MPKLFTHEYKDMVIESFIPSPIGAMAEKIKEGNTTVKVVETFFNKKVKSTFIISKTENQLTIYKKGNLLVLIEPSGKVAYYRKMRYKLLFFTLYRGVILSQEE